MLPQELNIIFQIKDRPDAWRPAWYRILSHIKLQIDRFFFYALDIPAAMGIDERGRSVWFELQQITGDADYARRVCRERGPTWHWRPLPTFTLLPAETVGYKPEEIPASPMNERATRHKTRLVVGSMSHIEEIEQRAESLLNQTSRMLAKSNGSTAKARSA